MQQIVVSGIGPVSSLGIGRTAFLEGLARGESGIAPATRFAAEHPVAEVRDLHLEAILPSIKTYLDRASEFTLAAAQLALTDAGLTPEHYTRWRAGVVLGSMFGCLGTMETFTTALQQKGPRLANPLLFSHMYVNTPTSLVSIEFGLGGHHGTFTGPDAGRQALEGAVEALTLDRADLLLVIGVDALCASLYQALAAEETMEAFGEGACALVMETAAHAAHRGATGIPLPSTFPAGTALRGALGRTFAAEPFFALAQQMMSVTAG